MRYRLVLQSVSLPLQRMSFEVDDRLDHLDSDGAICRLRKGQRLDMRADHGPLARPVRTNSLSPMNMAAIHAVCPKHIIGEDGKDTVDIPVVEVPIHALDHL